MFVLRLAPGSFYSFLIVEVISRKSVEYADIYDAKEAEAEGDFYGVNCTGCPRCICRNTDAQKTLFLFPLRLRVVSS